MTTAESVSLSSFSAGLFHSTLPLLILVILQLLQDDKSPHPAQSLCFLPAQHQQCGWIRGDRSGHQRTKRGQQSDSWIAIYLLRREEQEELCKGPTKWLLVGKWCVVTRKPQNDVKSLEMLPRMFRCLQHSPLWSCWQWGIDDLGIHVLGWLHRPPCANQRNNDCCLGDIRSSDPQSLWAAVSLLCVRMSDLLCLECVSSAWMMWHWC